MKRSGTPKKFSEIVYNDDNPHPVKAIQEAFSKTLPKLISEGKVSPKYVQNLTRAVQRMTPYSHKALNLVLDRIVFHPNTYEMQNHVFNLGRKFSEAIGKMGSGQMGGVYLPDYRHIHVDGDLSGHEDEGGEKSPTHGIYAHELAHAIDHRAAITHRGEWRQIHDDEFAGGQLGGYAATSPAESFAEFYRLTHTTRVPFLMSRKLFPKATQFFKTNGLHPADVDDPMHTIHPLAQKEIVERYGK